MPEKISIAAISQPQPVAGPWSIHHSHATAASAAIPTAAMISPSTVATRSGNTEKLIHALSHSRTNRRNV